MKHAILLLIGLLAGAMGATVVVNTLHVNAMRLRAA